MTEKQYIELVKRLRNRRICIQRLGSLEDFPLLKEAADAIEELSRENESLAKSVNEASEILRKRWIPVMERLPLYGQDVLAVRTYGDGEKCQEVLMAHIAVWNEETGKKWWNATNITHWMPIPQPPKEDKP